MTMRREGRRTLLRRLAFAHSPDTIVTRVVAGPSTSWSGVPGAVASSASDITKNKHTCARARRFSLSSRVTH